MDFDVQGTKLTDLTRGFLWSKLKHYNLQYIAVLDYEIITHIYEENHHSSGPLAWFEVLEKLFNLTSQYST